MNPAHVVRAEGTRHTDQVGDTRSARVLDLVFLRRLSASLVVDLPCGLDGFDALTAYRVVAGRQFEPADVSKLELAELGNQVALDDVPVTVRSVESKLTAFDSRVEPHRQPRGNGHLPVIRQAAFLVSAHNLRLGCERFPRRVESALGDSLSLAVQPGRQLDLELPLVSVALVERAHLLVQRW